MPFVHRVIWAGTQLKTAGYWWNQWVMIVDDLAAVLFDEQGPTDRPHKESDLFAAAINATRMAMVLTDPNQPELPIIYANPAFFELTGYDRAEVLGRNCRFLQGPGTDLADVARLRNAIENNEEIHIELLNYRRDGSTFWNSLYLCPIKTSTGATQYYFGSQFDVSRRKEAETEAAFERGRFEESLRERVRDAQTSLHEKTTLLHEVDHRVKNSFQMIAALISLEGRTVSDPTATGAFERLTRRVEALALVHKRLYDHDDMRSFDVTAFIEELVEHLLRAGRRSNLKADLRLQGVHLPVANATALALTVNETILNVIEQGFSETDTGKLRVASQELGPDRFCIVIETERLDSEASGKVLPFDGSSAFIKRLVSQFEGSIQQSTPAPSITRIEIEVPVELGLKAL